MIKSLKNIVLICLKVIGAIVVAGVILNIFSFFYYNPPIHISCDDGATGYRREPGAFWSRGAEGFAKGIIDENGYNNSFDTDYSDIDVLMMGSSQSEGLYVSEDKVASYIINKKFAENGVDMCLYNIGMSAHNFVANCSNLKSALEKYTPSKYVILEINSLDLKDDKVDSAIAGVNTVMSTTSKKSIMYNIQKIPYLKLAYQQFSNYKDSHSQAKAVEEPVYADRNKIEQLLKHISELTSEYGCKTIIFYIPSMNIEYDGTLSLEESEDKINEFSELCRNNNIIFVDLSDAILSDYEETGVLSSGFANTQAGYGHLNAHGHKLMADELYKAIIDNK